MKSSVLLVVTDTSIWVDLRKSGLVDAFFRLPFYRCVSDFVVEEKTIGIDWKLLFNKGLQKIQLSDEEISHLSSIRQNHMSTSVADLASFFVAKKNNGILLTGDDSLRKYSGKILEVHGFLWIMDNLVKERILNPSDAISILENLRLDPLVWLPAYECKQQIIEWQKIIKKERIDNDK